MRSTPPAAVATEAPEMDDGQVVQMPLGSLVRLLPESAVKPNGFDDEHLVGLPLRLILPQLSTGRIVLPLNEVLSRLPSEVVATPMPYAGAERVSLPIEEIIERLSPEMLRVRGDQREVELSDDIPSPFSEELLKASAAEPETPAIVEPEQDDDNSDSILAPFQESVQPEGPAAPASDGCTPAAEDAEEDKSVFAFNEEKPLFAPMAEQTPQVHDQEQKSESTAKSQLARANAPEREVALPLAVLLEAIPDSLLAGNRDSILASVDPNAKVSVCADDLITQLSQRHITLDLARFADKLPAGILSDDPQDASIQIEMEKIIEHLPVSLFTTDGGQARADEQVEVIPTPFQEVIPSQEPVQAPAEPSADETPAADTPIFVEAKQPAPAEEIEVAAVAPAEETVLQTDGIEVPSANEQQEVVTAAAEETTVAVPEQLFVESKLPAAEPAEVTSPAPAEPVAGVEPPAEKAEQPVAAAEEDLVELDAVAADEPVSAAVPVAQPALPRIAPEQIAEALADLNSWTEAELHQHSLGPTLSQRIMEYRLSRGGFKDLRELLKIAGIGPKLFQRVLGFAPEALDDQTRAINRLLGVSEAHEMTLQEIVKCASQLPGVEGCIVAMSDGLYMTGELPPRFDTQRVSAFAPQLFSRVGQYVHELKAGTARRLTIFTDAQPITIFKSGDLFFIVIHKANRFSKALLNKCERISEEVARLCAQENSAS